MRDRSSVGRSGSYRPQPGILALALGTLATLAAGDALAQARRGPIAVLGLRSPDGDDAAADTMTTALRIAARRLGFEPAETVPSLDQALATYSCDEGHVQDCLQQVAVEIHSARLIFGEAHHRGDTSAPVQITVSLYNASTRTQSQSTNVEVARATSLDDDALAPFALRVLNALIPPPAPGQVETIPPPPEAPPPPPQPAQPAEPPPQAEAPRTRPSSRRHHHHDAH